MIPMHAVQVGQLLTNLRVSTSNLLLPFTAQILQMLQGTYKAHPGMLIAQGFGNLR
jgi:hypothetical protein